jgi:hypothetical protein
MRTVPVRGVTSSRPALLAEIQSVFGVCHTLAQLMRWTATQSPVVRVSEIVTQDEYTHDVVLPFGAVFLSFDTT